MDNRFTTGLGVNFLPVAFLAVVFLVLAGVQAPELRGESKSIETYLKKKGLEETEAFRDLMKKALLEIRSLNYIQATEFLARAFSGFKEHPLPPLLLGFSFARESAMDRASWFTRKALSLYPGLRDSTFSYSRYQTDEEEMSLLLKRLRKECDAAPGESEEKNRLVFMTAMLLHFTGAKEEARAYFKRVEAESIEYKAAQFMLETPGKPKGEKKKAEKKDFFSIGNRYFLAGQYREAAFFFGFAYLADPSNVLACFELAHSLFAAGFFHKASRMLVHGLEQYPEWVSADMDRRTFYADGRQDDFAAHLKALRGAVEKDPRDPALHFLLAYNLHFSGRKAEAEKAFRSAKITGWINEADRFLSAPKPKTPGGDPTPPPPPPVRPAPPKDKKPSRLDTWLGHLAMGKKAFSLGRYKDAEAAYRKALSVRPDAPLVRFEVARALFAMEAFGQSVREIREGLKAMDVSERDSIRWKAAYDDKALFDRHLGALSKRIEGTPGGAGGELLFLHAFSLFYSGQFKKAAARFEQVFLANPRDDQAIYYFKLIDRLRRGK